VLGEWCSPSSSEARRANDLVGLIPANLLVGISFGWWSPSTPPTTPTQTRGPGPDISSTAVAFTADPASSRHGLVRMLARPQAWLVFPLLLLEAAHLHLASAEAIVRGSGRANAVGGCCRAVSPARSGAGVGVVAAAGAGLGGGPPGAVRPGPGLCVGPNHQGMPTLTEADELEFLCCQVLTSRTWPAAGWWISCWVGWTTRSSTTCSPTCPGRTCATIPAAAGPTPRTLAGTVGANQASGHSSAHYATR
jgi:hypothetical protein